MIARNLGEAVRKIYQDYQERVHAPLSSASRAVKDSYVYVRHGPVRRSDHIKQQYTQRIQRQNISYQQLHQLGLYALMLDEPLMAVVAFDEEMLLRTKKSISNDTVEPFLNLAEALAYANGMYDIGFSVHRYSHRVTRTGTSLEKAMNGFLAIDRFKRNPDELPKAVLKVVDEIMNRYGAKFEEYQPKSRVIPDMHKSVRTTYEEFQKLFRPERA